MAAQDEKIDRYLRRVRIGLRGLPDVDVTDILNELRAHIVERLQVAEGARDVAIDSVLQSFGRPEEIAALYFSENLVSRAESSRTPWSILRSLFYWATLSVKGFIVFMVCVIGYTFGVCFFIAALMKPFHPQGVGLWYESPDTGHFSLHIGGFAPHSGAERELLGWWLVPVGCSLGGGTILLTTQFALWSLRRLRHSRTERLA
jgi:HAAS